MWVGGNWEWLLTSMGFLLGDDGNVLIEQWRWLHNIVSILEITVFTL